MMSQIRHAFFLSILIFFSILFAVGLATPAHALGPIAIDSFTSLSAGTVSGNNIGSQPTTSSLGEDLVVGYNLGALRVGLGLGLRLVNQLTSVDNTVGSYAGNRWDVAPAVGLDVMGFTILGELLFKLGRYNLSNDLAGQSAYFSDPAGFRAILGMELMDLAFAKMGWGFIFEYVSYSSVSLNGNSSTLDSALKLWNFGLGLHLNF